MSDPVRAAGGAMVRRGADGAIELTVVHRPSYDDWTLPKGKLGSSEGFAEAAAREVEEETGFACRLGPALGDTEYRDGRGRRKVVRYWLMTPVSGGFRPNPEVDELRWLSPEEAAEILSYEPDRELVASLDAEVAEAFIG